MSFFSFISFTSYNGLRQEFLATCCVNMILLKDNSRAQTLNACFTSGFRVTRHVLLFMGFLSIAFSPVSRNCKEPAPSYH